MTHRRKTNYSRFDKFQEAIAQGLPNDWRCRAGSRYLYICEDGLVHYCSQQRGYPGVPLAGYTTADVKREFLTAKSCAPNCTIGCVHRISYIDHWRAPQTRMVSPGGQAGGGAGAGAEQKSYERQSGLGHEQIEDISQRITPLVIKLLVKI
jgi:hypothetical protein